MSPTTTMSRPDDDELELEVVWPGPADDPDEEPSHQGPEEDNPDAADQETVPEP